MYSDINPTFPDVKWYEYSYRKFFEPTETYETWKFSGAWDYPEKDQLRFSNIITNNVDLLTEKRVLDLGCHIGYLSLFALHNNATFVTGVNIRNDELAIGKEVIALAGYRNAEFISHDVTDFEWLATECSKHDTVIIAGLIYHLTDFVGFFRAITYSTAKNLIIESEILDTEQAYCKVVVEDATFRTNGVDPDGKETCLSIVPSRKFIVDILQFLGWNTDRESTQVTKTSFGREHTRLTLTATR